MEKSLLIRPEGLALLRSKVSDHLILDWLQLQQAGLEEFRITDLEEVLRVSRPCAKHKVFGLVKAGLVAADRMDSVYRVYKIVRSKQFRLSNGGKAKNGRI